MGVLMFWLIWSDLRADRELAKILTEEEMKKKKSNTENTEENDGWSKSCRRFGGWGKRVHNPGATYLSSCCNAPMYFFENDNAVYCSHCRKSC
jgi:hypothetical protein